MVTGKVVYLKVITLRIRLCIIQVKHKTDCSEKTETSKHELPLLACYGADYCPSNGLTPWVKWVKIQRYQGMVRVTTYDDFDPKVQG